MKNPIPTFREINVSSDDRGTFVNFLEDAHSLTDAKCPIKRVYYVYNYAAGTVRGFHFHKREWKFFMIVSGAAKFVALDPNKPETQYSFISSFRKPNLIIIPPGYANGWISLEPQTILVCGSTSTIKESIADDKRFDPYKWGDFWTVQSR